jgi:hypothetical protein
MNYQIGGCEERRGRLYGWTGRRCARCRGTGAVHVFSIGSIVPCVDCAGTGDEWGLMSVQPALDCCEGTSNE